MEADVHQGANGSARVVLGQGATEVLAVVKARFSQLYMYRPAPYVITSNAM